MARGFFGALDSFAGGLSQGIERGDKMRRQNAQDAREQQQADDLHADAVSRQTKSKAEEALTADLGATSINGLMYTGQDFNGMQGFMSRDEAKKAVQAPAGAPLKWQDQYAAPDWQQRLTKLNPLEEAQFKEWAKTANAPDTPDYDMRGYWKSGDYKGGTTVNQNDGLPHFNDRWKTPLHKSFSGESTYADPSKKPPTWNDKDQLVTSDGSVLLDERAKPASSQAQVQDPNTHIWYNVDAAQTRTKSLAEQARDAAAVYLRHGKPSEAFSILRDGVQAQVAQSGLDKQERADALETAMYDPAAFARVTRATLGQLGLHADVTTVPVDLGKGKAGAALQFNISGTNAPPFYFDAQGNVTHDPKQADYNATAQRVLGMVKGDTAGALTAILGQQAQIQSIVASKHSMSVQDKELALRSWETKDASARGWASVRTAQAATQAQIDANKGAAPKGINPKMWKEFGDNVMGVVRASQGEKTYGQALSEVLALQPRSFQDAYAQQGAVVDTTAAPPPSVPAPPPMLARRPAPRAAAPTPNSDPHTSPYGAGNLSSPFPRLGLPKNLPNYRGQ